MTQTDLLLCFLMALSFIYAGLISWQLGTWKRLFNRLIKLQEGTVAAWVIDNAAYKASLTEANDVIRRQSDKLAEIEFSMTTETANKLMELDVAIELAVVCPHCKTLDRGAPPAALLMWSHTCSGCNRIYRLGGGKARP